MIEVSSSNFIIKYLFLFISIFSFSQSKVDTILFYDLSNKQLKKMPDLSKKIIKKLDLSNNKIDSIIYNRLPRGIEELNLSYNNFTDNFNNNFILNLSNNQTCNNSLTKVNLSHNKIKFLLLECSCGSIDVSNNQLYQINGNVKGIKYLDVSNNTNLPPTGLGIAFKEIKEIKRDNLKTNEPLKSWLYIEDTHETNPNLKLISAEELQKNK